MVFKVIISKVHNRLSPLLFRQDLMMVQFVLFAGDNNKGWFDVTLKLSGQFVESGYPPQWEFLGDKQPALAAYLRQRLTTGLLFRRFRLFYEIVKVISKHGT